jgi:hypothetical protein
LNSWCRTRVERTMGGHLSEYWWPPVALAAQVSLETWRGGKIAKRSNACSSRGFPALPEGPRCTGRHRAYRAAPYGLFRYGDTVSTRKQGGVSLQTRTRADEISRRKVAEMPLPLPLPLPVPLPADEVMCLEEWRLELAEGGTD